MRPSQHWVKRDSPSRVADTCDLRPPLRESYALQWKARVIEPPIIADGYAFFADPTRRGALTARQESDGQTAWRQELVGSAELFQHGRLVAVSNSGLQVVNPATGDIEREFGFLAPFGIAGVENLLVGLSYVDGAFVMYCADFHTGSDLWCWSSGKSPVTCLFAASLEALCFGLGGGGVLALNPRTGNEIWRGSVGDLRHPKDDGSATYQVSGTAIIHEGRVLFEVSDFGAVAHSLKDGKRLWAQPCGSPQASALYDGRYYILNAFGLFVLDPVTGEVISHKHLSADVPGESIQPRNPLLISETHVFTGSREGYVLAFDRQTGEHVWSHRPKGGQSNAGFEFASANGRLYYCDMSFRMYCMEYDPENEGQLRKRSTEAQRRRPKAPSVAGIEGGLGFDVVNVLSGQVLRNEPPWHVPGGQWTVLECRTRGRHRATFYIAEDGQRREGTALVWAKGALWVPTAEDGRALVESFRTVFTPTKKIDLSHAHRTAGPVRLRIALIPSEKEGWTRTKWNTRHDAEFFLSWNVDERLGVLGEKAEGYRIQVLKQLAALIKD